MMLLKLLSSPTMADFKFEVVSLLPNGPVGTRIQALGVPVRSLDMRRGITSAAAFTQMLRILRRNRPDVVQTWMWHSDLVGGLAAKALAIPVVWGVRGVTQGPGAKRLTHLAVWACARLSRRVPNRIVACDEASMRAHLHLGYDPAKMLVIPNAFDLDTYRPDPESRSSVRAELHLGERTPIVGLVARFHPYKDHQTFTKAAALLAARLPDVRFILCGDGVTSANLYLASWIEAAGLGDRMLLLGPRSDVPRLLAAFDIAVSSSHTEGFPNVIGEAMACGVPCVVTDVGDSARIVDDAGRVVPRQDPIALAGACYELLTASCTDRAELGKRARQRIARNFDLPRIATQYRDLYHEVSVYGRETPLL